MDYKKIKELLLDDSRKLKLKEATEILKILGENRKMYTQLLKNAQCSQKLMCYAGFNDKTCIHEFEEVDINVPSLKIAKKFFNLCDEEITKDFITMLIVHLPQKACSNLVFAWPYMSIDALKTFTKDIFFDICCSSFFVFDFSLDKCCTMCEFLFNAFEEDNDRLEILSSNSFNIDWQVFSNKCYGIFTPEAFLKYHSLSIHSFGANDRDYGMFRKLFIDYMRLNIAIKKDFHNSRLKAMGILLS